LSVVSADRGLSRGVFALAAVLACAAALGASGAPAFGTGRIPLVRGGEGAKPGELPSLAFVAYLVPNEKGEAVVCTGTVLSARLVLTAAHCVKPPDVRFSVENFRIVTGDVNWKAPDRQVLHVARAIGYPRYNSRSGQGDAALLELSEPTEAPPMPLAGRRFWSAGSEAEIAGWGKVHLGQHGVTYLLHRASIAVLGSRECRLQGGRQGQVCAEDPPPRKASPCYGDSGGPLLAHRPGDGRLVEIGVVHGGANCNPRFPGLFTSTVPIFDWVRARMAEVRSP
jgi:secreted trypsin-like serine protease